MLFILFVSVFKFIAWEFRFTSINIAQEIICEFLLCNIKSNVIVVTLQKWFENYSDVPIIQ